VALVKIDRLTKTLALAALLSAGHPGAAHAQSLFFSPNPAAFTISGPGASAGPITVSVSSTAPVSSVNVAGISTNDGTNWLCAIANGSNSVNVYVGTGGCSSPATTSQLANNANYTGHVTVQGNGGLLISTFDVTLQVGTVSGGPGLAANPSSVSFTESAPGQATPASQTVSVTLNGAPIAITGANFTPSSASVPFFISTAFNNGTVILTVNSTVTTAGVYQGTETLITNSGNVNVPITLTFGSGGLAATPNPLSFSVQTGGNAAAQNVSITFNGAPITITNVTTSGGATWLLPSFQPGVAGNVSVAINAAGLSAGMYNGIVTVSTQQGQIGFQVNLTVAGIPTLNVNPLALNFAYQLGTSNPLSQTVSITSNGSPVSISVSATTSSGGGQWLIVSPTGQATTPTTLTVSVNPAGLGAGSTYQGNIQINTFGTSTNPVLNIPVSLLITNSPILAANPTSLTFTAPAGSNPASQNLQITSSSSPLNYTITPTITTPAGGGWLQVPAQSGSTPGAVVISVNTQGLAAGTYTGTITAASQTAGNPPVSVPVTLTITSGAALQLNPASLSFAYQTGQAQPASQTVTVGSASAAQVNYTVAAQTNSGQSWLNVSANGGTTPGSFVVSVNTSGLGPATYSGSINVTAAGSAAQTIPVTLVVSNTALLVLSPGGLTFSIPAGTTTSSFQNIAVTSTDGTPITFNVATSTGTSSNWLLASSGSGTTAANLTFSANPNGLAIGAYTGTVTIAATSPANVANSPQTLPVTLNITPTATLSVSPASLSFTQNTNSSAPAAQALTVTAVGGPIAFAANVTLFQGLNWLTVTPTNATVSASSPVTLTVTANGAALSPGTYNGQISLTSPGASNTVVVNVAFTVSNAPTITVSPASLSPAGFQIGGPNPGSQTISVSIAGGGAVAFNASGSTASGFNWLSVTPTTGTTPGNVVITFNAAGLAAGVYQGTVSITVAGATNSPLTLPVTLTVSPAPVIAPTVAAVQHAASFISTSVAPGLNIVLQGANMGPATLVAYQVSNGAVATTLAGTQVTFDGIPAPVIYTSSVVASVMVPYEIAGRVSTVMVVNYNGAASTPLQLRVVDTAPGIYTLTQNGSGQGAILDENGTVNSPANPEVSGHFIQIYATGEGQTSPPGVDGRISASQLPLPAPNLPVTVAIGGIEVPASDISYAGEAPSNVSGVIQVNARIPQGVGSGAVPVVIRVGGVPSQANVTVSVR
jgi:uncharacterized protein (TIGR03437 family)